MLGEKNALTSGTIPGNHSWIRRANISPLRPDQLTKTSIFGTVVTSLYRPNAPNEPRASVIARAPGRVRYVANSEDRDS